MLATVAAPGSADADVPAQPDATIEYLWPCNVPAWGHWQGVQTQWRTSGMGGPTGLDYAGVRAYLDECALAGDERTDAWAGIRAAEHATLAAWAQQRRDKAATPPPPT